MGSRMGRMDDVGAIRYQIRKVAVAGERKAAAVMPGNCAERHESDQSKDRTVIEDGHGDREIPIGGQANREEKFAGYRQRGRATA